MTLLDAYALVAFLAGERAADEVEKLLRDGEAAIPAVNLAEALDVMTRVRRHSATAVDAALVPVLATTLRVLTIGEAEARLAAGLRIRHYQRKTAPLSLADCLLLSTALIQRARVATSDPPLAVACRGEGVEVAALPDPAGRRP